MKRLYVVKRGMHPRTLDPKPASPADLQNGSHNASPEGALLDFTWKVRIEGET